MSDAEARMRRGRAAGDERTALREAFADVRTALLDKFERSDPKDIEERQAVYFELRALEALRRRLSAYVAEGQLEESKRST